MCSFQVAGFLTVFSSELSVFVLMVITLERWYAISYAIHLTKRLRIRQAWCLMLTGWIYASTMALLPLVGVSGYGAVSMCLPMEAKDVWDKVYIVSLLLLNGLAFLVICCCYISMFLKVRALCFAILHSKNLAVSLLVVTRASIELITANLDNVDTGSGPQTAKLYLHVTNPTNIFHKKTCRCYPYRSHCLQVYSRGCMTNAEDFTKQVG